MGMPLPSCRDSWFRLRGASMSRHAAVICPPLPRHSGSTDLTRATRGRTTMRTIWAGRALPLLALAIFSAACETGTDPDGMADFQSALADYQALDKALASPGWAGFQALGGRTPFSASPAAIEA